VLNAGEPELSGLNEIQGGPPGGLTLVDAGSRHKVMMMVRGDYYRWMYRGGRPNAWARWQNTLSAWLHARGVMPRRLVTLEVPGRVSGRTVALPLVLTELDGERYLVSMLGERVNWVANVRANDHHATLRHGVVEAVRLQEVPVEQRARVIQRYVHVAPGGRPHIPIDRHAPLEAFTAVAADTPVFRIAASTPRTILTPTSRPSPDTTPTPPATR
jgi:F420H(2)-dependent quinone reductase